jgi:hypothetical protein
VLDPTAIATVVGCLVAIIAAWYAYAPYRNQRILHERELFVETRRTIARDRHRLAADALALYGSIYKDARLPGMVTSQNLIPDAPISLHDVRVQLAPAPHWDHSLQAASRRLLPRRTGGRRMESYSEAISDLAVPSLWFDAPCYSLSEVEISGKEILLTVSLSSYFEGIDIAESLAHELAEHPKAGGLGDLRLRSRIESPVAFGTWPSVCAVSALVLRQDVEEVTFFLQERDPSKVAQAGGQIHLVPSGVYQPTASDPGTVQRDIKPLLTLCREFAEEYLGVEEARGDDGASLSYDQDEPYASLLRVMAGPDSSSHVLGIGMDPLTLCPEILVVSIFTAKAFDALFKDLKFSDAEGRLMGASRAGGRLIGFSFSRQTLDHLTSSPRLSPAARGTLECAWNHRRFLLGGKE